MNVTVRNQQSLNSPNNFLGLYNNGHFSSEIRSTSVPITFNSLQSSRISNPRFKLEFEDFDTDFNFEITEVEKNKDPDQIVLSLNLDNKLSIKAVMNGLWIQESEYIFKINNFHIELDKKQETPISAFLYSTLWAIFALSKGFRVYIPEIDLDFQTRFELPIDEVSKILQERQIAYKLLVIEVATGINFSFPDGYINGEDIESITYFHKAIVEREFDWFAVPRSIPWEANQENLSHLPPTKDATSITFAPDIINKSIFGFEISVGSMTGRIENAVIDNYEEVKGKLSKLDNKIVNVQLRSVNGTIKMIAVDVPQLPQNPWNDNLQKLIELDSQLDEKVLERYFNLASSTLEGLDEKQKEEITKRPKLDQEAFDF